MKIKNKALYEEFYKYESRKFRDIFYFKNPVMLKAVNLSVKLPTIAISIIYEI